MHEADKFSQTEKATFAAGCFWGVQEAFRQVEGVTATRVGYTGGQLDKPTYEDVCTSRTGHAESVEIEFDSGLVTYEQLLEVFWSIHDPTTPDRQGVDIGSQYRSAIFFHDELQKSQAIRTRNKLTESTRFEKPLVTEIVPAGIFWEAEDYHQQYIAKQGQASCHRSDQAGH